LGTSAIQVRSGVRAIGWPALSVHDVRSPSAGFDQRPICTEPPVNTQASPSPTSCASGTGEPAVSTSPVSM
jgi:hypothetical protein